MERALLRSRHPRMTIFQRTLSTRALRGAFSLAFLTTLGLTSLAHGLAMAPYGNRAPVTPAVKVIPATHCAVGDYAAFANAADDAADTYALSGKCNINVAPANASPVMQDVRVQILAEWSPKMKRASETVKIVHPDKTVTFNTWATCTADPFLHGSPATCSDQGMGANDFQMFLDKGDVPFARRRVSTSTLAQVTERTGTRARLYEQGKITTIEGPTTTALSGADVVVSTSFAGGPGACPMEVDFGDGYVQQALTSEQPGRDVAAHAYKRGGSYTVEARALPGCTGKASTKVVVADAAVTTIAGGPTKARAGEVSTVIVNAKNGACKFNVDFGDGKVETLSGQFAATGGAKWIQHTYYTPGRKNLKVTGMEGCTGAQVGYVDVDASAVKTLQSWGKLGTLNVVQATALGGVCPLRVDWGDGSVEDMPNVTFLEGKVTLTHSYKKTGTFLVSARGIDGCVGVAGANVTVK